MLEHKFIVYVPFCLQESEANVENEANDGQENRDAREASHEAHNDAQANGREDNDDLQMHDQEDNIDAQQRTPENDAIQSTIQENNAVPSPVRENRETPMINRQRFMNAPNAPRSGRRSNNNQMMETVEGKTPQRPCPPSSARSSHDHVQWRSRNY